MTFSAASQPFFSYQYCVYKQGVPTLRKLIFNCACSHENGVQKIHPWYSLSGRNEYTTPGDEQEIFQWGLWVSKEQFRLAYKLIRAVINCEQPMPYEEEHLSP